jgi:hypothetical protein
MSDIAAMAEPSVEDQVSVCGRSDASVAVVAPSIVATPTVPPIVGVIANTAPCALSVTVN